MAVRVEFIGICTHLRRDPQNEDTRNLPVPHRVVLVDARDETDFDDRGKVPAHEAMLRIRGLREMPHSLREIAGLDGPWTSWHLNGVRLTIVPAGDPGQVEYRSWNVPVIQDLRPNRLVAGVLSASGDAGVMDACFDVTGGTFESKCHDQAHGAMLTVDAGSAPILVVTPLGMPSPGKEIQLEPDAEIQIRHVATRHGHADANHFYLHYLIAGRQLPPGAKPFMEPCGGGPTLSGPISLGPDCSNSSYP